LNVVLGMTGRADLRLLQVFEAVERLTWTFLCGWQLLHVPAELYMSFSLGRLCFTLGPCT